MFVDDELVEQFCPVKLDLASQLETYKQGNNLKLRNKRCV